jgi:hypothetical protein
LIRDSPMNIKLRNNTWKVVMADLSPSVRGEIDPPSYVNKRIKLSTSLRKQQELLEVFLHECLHGCFWDLDEDVIDQAALDISRGLYKLGARIEVTKLTAKKKKKSKP